MAKRTRKKNLRLKKTARRTIAAVLMISAIMIALIPVPDIKAGTSDYSYIVGPDEIINTSPYNLDSSSGEVKDSYTLKKLGDMYQYDNQFSYYLASDGNAIISKYNSTFSVDTLTIPTVLTPKYEHVTLADYDRFASTCSQEYVLSGDPTTCSDAWFFKKYDLGRYNDYVSKYNDYVIQHQKYENDTHEPKEEVDGVMPERITKDAITLSNDQKLAYYCDKNITDNSAEGYTLKKVLNANSTGIDGDYIYIPQGGTNNMGLNDENGFLMSEGNPAPVIAIAKGAFKGTQNVKTLNMSDNIKYVGDEAFMNTWVESVSFGNASSIGNRAFKNCNKLTSISLSSATTQIGAEAFYGTYIRNLSMEASVAVIGSGAFANCIDLEELDLSKITTADSVIKEFAFYDDYSLNKVSMSGSSIKKIEKGAFAVSSGVRGSWVDVEFPSNIEQQEDLGDYVLAGRTNLRSVTMPANYGRYTEVTFPNGTLENCINLEKLIFPDDKNGSCGHVNFEMTGSSPSKTTVFSNIVNENFCVYGPEKNNETGIAAPRLGTRAAYTQVSNTVPYIYKDRNDVTYIEMSDSDYLLVANQNGELVSCDTLPGSVGDIEELVIPSVVGGYDINTIKDGCFTQEFKDKVKNITIEDNSVKSIADNTFKDCPKLETVHIGNSVNSIGKDAFKNCPELENVYFSTPESYSGFEMKEGAFETGAQQLTFHGDIIENYAPFEWAMQYVVDSTRNTGVCYKSNAPTNLTVMSYKDPVTNEKNIVLVDYPFYENIDKDNVDYRNKQDTYYKNMYPEGSEERNAYNDWIRDMGGSYSILNKYKYLMEHPEITDLKPYQIMSQMELDIIAGTQNITVPAGVDSIDAKSFFKSPQPTNAGNITAYVKDSFGESGFSKQNLYTKDVESDDYNTTIYGGLFSGNFEEDSPAETVVKGNDRVSSITLTNVKRLPDNAFDNCENLESINLGDCIDVGKAPFVGCTNLKNITSNDAYEFQNGILYKKNDDGTLTIIQCLPARGNLIKPKTITSESDPLLEKVSAIEEGAFQNCDSISLVDLSDATNLEKIPENCFNDCLSLRSVTLPESVNEILDNAFTSCGGTAGSYNISVEIPGKEVHITHDAFDHNTGEICTYKDSAAYSYGKLYDIDVVILGEKFKVVFYDYDMEILDIQQVKEGQAAKAPATPTREDGYIFSSWNPSDFSNVTEDMVIMATYSKPDGFEVKFLDYDGKIISTQYVKSGNSATVPVSPTRAGYTFSGWSVDATKLANITEDTTAIAQYTANGGTSGGNNGNNNGSNSGNNDDSNSNSKSSSNTNQNKTYHKLTVKNGSGSGYYYAGYVVNISAFAPPAGQNFQKWTSTSNGVGFTNAFNSSTTFTMPDNSAEVVANFGVGTASSNNTVPDTNKSGSSSGGSGSRSGGSSSNSTGTKPGGTVISITKPGFSDTDKANAVVHGSTDNYIIKITEDANAQAQIEAALLADSETLENIKYFPMDISLYDSTGTTKITDTSGVSIDITLPLPDELREYGGNNKVAGVVNGSLDKLTPTFKSIDGVPCVTFTATHFSPYTIYVDTANLSDGTIDSSPKTGDPIHPKWFLVIGLASISILLFMKRDRRRVIKIS